MGCSCGPGGGEDEEEPRTRAGVWGGGMGGRRSLSSSDCSIQRLLYERNCLHAGRQWQAAETLQLPCVVLKGVGEGCGHA